MGYGKHMVIIELMGVTEQLITGGPPCSDAGGSDGSGN